MKFPFSRKKESFFLVSVGPERAEGVLFSLSEDHVLKPEKYWNDLDGGEMPGIANRLKKVPTIVSVHPALAATVTVPVQLKRSEDSISEPLTAGELEDILAQATVRVFGECREKASRDLGVEEIDTIVVGNRVGHFKVDGHKVLDPTGFPARHIEAVLELTLTTRQIFDIWKHSFNRSDDFFFTESSRAELFAIHKVHALPVTLLLLDADRAFVFTIDRAPVGTLIYRRELEWALRSLLSAIAEEWGVDIFTAEKVYRTVLKREVSEGVSRSLMKAMKPALDALLRALAGLKLSGSIFVDTPLPLPFVLPHKRGRVTLTETPLSKILGHFGFYTDPESWPFPGEELVRRLAPFMEFYYNKGDTVINRWLKRRIHWIGQQ